MPWVDTKVKVNNYYRVSQKQFLSRAKLCREVKNFTRVGKIDEPLLPLRDS
jgi:hypothetical protein